MGRGKSEASRRAREGKTGDDNGHVKGENFYRSAKRVKQLKVFKDGGPQRNAQGKITKAAPFQSRDVPTAVIEPNRKWFQNTRVISQDSLQAFRTAMAEHAKDPYRVLLKTNKLPLSLIRDGQDNTVNGVKQHRAKILVETAPFSEVLKRKRVRLDVSTLADLAGDAEKHLDKYTERIEEAKLQGGNTIEAGLVDLEEERPLTTAREPVFSKGRSARIWNELYRTIDSSDVVLFVLDARDPMGTRCKSVEEHLRKEAPHKHLVFILNKCDLVPNSVAVRWISALQKIAPTCAFRSSVTNPFGRGSLISLLRQFSVLHSDRKQISVGCVGYPNVGKSSLINTLRGKKTCVTAPIPGCTKVWQFVSLMKRISLIDSPGIVPPDQNASEQDILLRGAVRTEKVENPAQYIPAALDRIKKHHLARTYELSDWNDTTHFLELLARKRGRLLAGGEPDVDGVARVVLNDFLRGRLPWYVAPPSASADEEKGRDGRDGRAGRFGEMPRKRKRDDADDSVVDTSMGTATPSQLDEGKTEEEEFAGFGPDSDPGSELDDVLSDEEDSAAGNDADDVISLGASSEEEEEDNGLPGGGDGEKEGSSDDSSEAGGD